MLLHAIVAPLLTAAPPAESPVTLSASLNADELTVGEAHQIALTATLADGWIFPESRTAIRGLIVQIDVPRSATLAGQVLTDPRELARNEYLQSPYERLVEPGETTIEFTLNAAAGAAPGPALAPASGGNETIGVNITAYVQKAGTDEHVFIRRRLELPLKAGAEAVEGNAGNTHWGAADTLHVGDMADAFSLPQFGGAMVDLKDHLGRKNIIITTYRAHW